ncbi:MAG: nucleoside triphosphate pyrophosphohydrolase [Acidimicrobiales bacterium]|nr:MAG: nucleoside triphosphate pyrophosphohydrolase [Acidimicrobiales bacterium]
MTAVSGLTGPRVTVVGLGPGDPSLMSVAAREALASCERRFLRTRAHPSAEVAEPAESFDSVYEEASDLGEVYERIVDALLAAARDCGEVAYAVPGSPLVAERTVVMLRQRGPAVGVAVEVVPSMSFVDLAWHRLGVDPATEGVRIVDAHRFAEQAAGWKGPMLVVQCDSRLVLSDVKLAVEDAPSSEVTVLRRLGCADEQVFTVAWEDLDRSFEPDHLTSLWVPSTASPPGAALVALEELVRTLRQRCPWDREQTHQSLTRHLVEETYEVLDAIAGVTAGDAEAGEALEEELGDLLFQVFFHAVLAAERGWFTIADVARRLHDKLVARHPHVFGDVTVRDAGEVRRNWERIKREEKGRGSVMDGIPSGLPSLALAAKVQRKAAAVGLDFPDLESVLDKIGEELEELRREPSGEELGDLLFAACAAAVRLEVDPETALRSAARKFVERFRVLERLAAERGVDLGSLSSSEWDELWEAGKAGG